MNFTEFIGHPTWPLSRFSQKQRFPTKHGSSTVRVKCARSPSRTSAPDHSIPPPAPGPAPMQSGRPAGAKHAAGAILTTARTTRGVGHHIHATGHTETCTTAVFCSLRSPHPIGLTKPVASEAFVQTKHAALLIKPSTQPEMTSASEHAPAHATEKGKEMRSRAVVVFVGHH